MRQIGERPIIEAESVEVGSRLRKVREALKLKQKDFAIELELSPSHLSEIEKGKKKPGFSVLKILYRKYGVNLHWLLENSGDMFAGGSDSGHLIRVDFGDQNERFQEMVSYMSQSPFFLSYMMSLFMKSFIEYERTIMSDIERNRE